MDAWTIEENLRKEKGLTREELSSKVGISVTQLYRLETGKNNYRAASVSTVQAIAEALDTTVEYLLSDASKTQIDRFFAGLNRLPHKELIALRKGAGMYMKDAPQQAVIPFFKVIAGMDEIPDEEVDAWFATACFYGYCMFHQVEGVLLSIPEIYGKMVAKQPKGASRKSLKERLEKDIAHTLDTPFANGGGALYRINKMVRLANQEGYNVSCKFLLDSMLRWDEEKGEYEGIGGKWAKLFVNELDPSDLKI